MTVPGLRCRFGGLELDEAAHELRHVAGPIPLQPKELALLVHLVRHRERVVSYGELQQTLWSGSSATAAAIHRAISRLRTALRCGSFPQPPIRTHAGLGYRFVAAVDAPPDLEEEQAPATLAQVAVVAVQFVARWRLDPETWLAELERVRTAAAAAVARFGGSMTATGHGVLAYFTGSDMPMADAALQAARTLVDSVRDSTLAVRIGIHVDAAMLVHRAGALACDVAVGEATAGALRARELARPNSIVISRELRGELREGLGRGTGVSTRSIARARPAEHAQYRDPDKNSVSSPSDA